MKKKIFYTIFLHVPIQEIFYEWGNKLSGLHSSNPVIAFTMSEPPDGGVLFALH